MFLSGLSFNVAFPMQKAWAGLVGLFAFQRNCQHFPHWVCAFLRAGRHPWTRGGSPRGSSCRTVKLRTSRPRVPWVCGARGERLISFHPLAAARCAGRSGCVGGGHLPGAGRTEGGAGLRGGEGGGCGLPPGPGPWCRVIECVHGGPRSTSVSAEAGAHPRGVGLAILACLFFHPNFSVNARSIKNVGWNFYRIR